MASHSGITLKYGLDDRMSLGPLLMMGMQWLMICIPVVLTSTFVAPEGETIAYSQKMFAVMGITMIAQVIVGHRMPLVAGPAAVLLMGVITASSQGYDASTIYPAMMIGGAIVAIMALCGILSRVQHIFTPRIVVSILLLVSFTTAKPIIGLIFADSNHHALALLFALICVPVMAVANNLLIGVWKSAVVIVAMIVGSALYYAITGFPTSLAADTVKPSLILPRMQFDAGIILAFVFCYVALIVNQVGSVQSLGEVVGAENMARRHRLGTCITGVMNIVAGAVGVLGPVDYSLSPGVVASSSCASRYTMLPAAIVMVILALFPKAVAVLLLTPLPVMGVVLLYLMATQVAAGFSLMQATGAAVSFRDGMVLGIPVMFNIILSFAPAETIAVIPSMIRPIVGNGFVMGIIIILLLEHVLLRKK